MKSFATIAAFVCAVGIAPAAFAQDQPRFVLSGVVVKPDGGALAWLQEPAITQNKTVLVRQGDRIGAYRLASIAEDRVELEGPSGKVVVRLYTTGASTPAPAASAPPRPATPAGAVVGGRAPASPAMPAPVVPGPAPSIVPPVTASPSEPGAPADADHPRATSGGGRAGMPAPLGAQRQAPAGASVGEATAAEKAAAEARKDPQIKASKAFRTFPAAQ